MAKHQRTQELRIYRHRARRKNKWRLDYSGNASHPLPPRLSHKRIVAKQAMIFRIVAEQEVEREIRPFLGKLRLEERSALHEFSGIMSHTGLVLQLQNMDLSLQ